MKRSGFGFIIGILIGLLLQFAGLGDNAILLTAAAVFGGAVIGYLVDLLVYITGPYQVERRLQEVTRR